MAESNKLEIKDATLVLAHTTNANSIAVAQISIESRLRTIILIKDLDARLGGRGTTQRLRLALVVPQRGLDVLHLGRGLVLELETDAGGVAIEDGDSITRRGDTETVLVDKLCLGLVEPSKDLARLRLQLVFLARDEGHHIINHIHGADTRVSRS